MNSDQSNSPFRFDGDQPLLDELSTGYRDKYIALRDYVTELMLDVREDGLDCGCRACQRLRRGHRALEAADGGMGDA